jgi:hypothetical protein
LALPELTGAASGAEKFTTIAAAQSRVICRGVAVVPDNYGSRALVAAPSEPTGYLRWGLRERWLGADGRGGPASRRKGIEAGPQVTPTSDTGMLDAGVTRCIPRRPGDS